MIQNDQELRIVQEQLARVERALASLRQDALPKNQRTFCTLAEADVEMIQQLRREIDDYLGIPVVLAAREPAAASA
jgi:hypothetical protein